MLDRYERDILRGIERQISSADPDLAALLRDQRHLAQTRLRSRLRRVVIVLLAVLVVGLLVLGLPGSAVLVALVAVAVWWLGRCHVTIVG